MSSKRLAETLWRIYNRPERPVPFAYGGNLPWDDPDFSERMLREHLDQSHSAASRTDQERPLQVDWLWEKMALRPGQHILDVTCGPGLYAVALAQHGCAVTGVDFAPASIRHARTLAEQLEVADRCQFIEADVHQWAFPKAAYDAALLLYGQLAVMSREQAQTLLGRVRQSLKPGGVVCVEMLDQERVDKRESNWWYTDDKGLWGDRPFLHLGERHWYADEQISMERYYMVDLESGELLETILCDQTYGVAEMKSMLQTAGFAAVSHFAEWDGLPLYDAAEWNVYLATLNPY